MNHLLNSLAVFRLTRLISQEECPYEACAKFRDLIGVQYTPYGVRYGTNELAKGILCAWCLSLWIAFALARGNLRTALAYSAIAGILSTIVDWMNA